MNEMLYSSCFEIPEAEHASVASRSGCSGAKPAAHTGFGINIELCDIRTIKPYEHNPRLNDKAVEAVAVSLREFGFRQPIVVDAASVIIAGHTRYKAALQLGLRFVPVHIATDLSPEQVKAYRIADNKTDEIAEWDLNILPIELNELQESGFDLHSLAFNDRELNQLLTMKLNDGLTDPDEVPETPAASITNRGDIWRLGEHRLLCGDSTAFSDVAALCENETASMVFTDPPYNVAYGNSMKDVFRKRHRAIQNNNLGVDFENFLENAISNMLKFNNGAVYICMSTSELHTLYNCFISAGDKWSTFIIWCKNTFTIGRSDYQRQYEAILYGWNKDASHYWCGARNQSDIWEYKKPQRSELHPTMKPVELVSRAIQNSSKVGEFVLDTFGGSGSTLIACEQTGRRCLTMEIDPLYCDVIVKRWETFTGKKSECICATKI